MGTLVREAWARLQRHAWQVDPAFTGRIYAALEACRRLFESNLEPATGALFRGNEGHQIMGVAPCVWDCGLPAGNQEVVLRIFGGVRARALKCKRRRRFSARKQLVDVQLFCFRSATFFQREKIILVQSVFGS